MDKNEAFAELRALAEKWKKEAADTRRLASYGTYDGPYVRERCAKELLDKVFELESKMK